MRYYKFVENGYIVAVGTGTGGEEISVDEYSVILKTIQGKPAPPEGKDYRLTESLEWEEYDRPEEVDPEATTEDYQTALMEMGVTV